VEPAAAFRRILVPLDFSRSALGAYAVALALARRQEAELILLHVLDLRTFAAMEKLGVKVPPDKLKMIRHRVRLSFRGLIGSSKAAKMRRILREGEPFTEIMKVARVEKVDLIVIGTYGGYTGDLEKILFGSTAEKVVRAAPCPVLCVPLSSSTASEEFEISPKAAHA
jgi:nucleotide-binding universal stress UspA family protein